MYFNESLLQCELLGRIFHRPMNFLGRGGSWVVTHVHSLARARCYGTRIAVKMDSTQTGQVHACMISPENSIGFSLLSASYAFSLCTLHFHFHFVLGFSIPGEEDDVLVPESPARSPLQERAGSEQRPATARAKSPTFDYDSGDVLVVETQQSQTEAPPPDELRSR